jgi:hypothetical protein
VGLEDVDDLLQPQLAKPVVQSRPRKVRPQSPEPQPRRVRAERLEGVASGGPDHFVLAVAVVRARPDDERDAARSHQVLNGRCELSQRGLALARRS